MKSSTTNVENSNVNVFLYEEEVFHESSESFHEESSFLNDVVQQDLEEVDVPSSNTQSISNNMFPNVDEASTSHNVFNEHLKDAYFDASTWFHDPSNIFRICLWIMDSGCSKHMTGNRALLTNFVEKFLGMVRFGNNDSAVIAGYGDVVIESMSIKKVYYVKGLGHNLFSVGQFYDKGLEVAF
nr:integrase, catalytic region, zinc finger, CCHC-type, peptidase aspartic, catalytic [Tanacetum cinerariifolium]